MSYPDTLLVELTPEQVERCAFALADDPEVTARLLVEAAEARMAGTGTVPLAPRPGPLREQQIATVAHLVKKLVGS